MYFGLSDDALALRDGLREVLLSACSPVVIRAAWEGDPCEPLWKTLGSFGLPGLLADEGVGGLSLDELSFVAALEEAGWHGVPGPLVETMSYLPVLDLPVDGSARIAVQRPRMTNVPYAAVASHIVSSFRVSPAESAPVVETVDRSRAVAALSPSPERAIVATEQ